MEAVCLGEVERQVMRQDAMPQFGLGACDHLVGLRQLLDVADARNEGIAENLNRADLQNVQDDLRILRIVLLPAVVQCLPCSGERDRGDKLQVETCRPQSLHQGSVIVTSRLEPDGDGHLETTQQRDQALIIVSWFSTVMRRRRVLSGTAISASWRFLEISMPT
jgi:hypothetical protein